MQNHVHYWERDTEECVNALLNLPRDITSLEVMCNCGEMILLRSNGAEDWDDLKVWVDPFLIGYDGIYVIDPFMEQNHG